MRVTVKDSSASGMPSPCTFTVITFVISPAAKVTIPLGNPFPTKSPPLAALVPLPVTAQFTAVIPLVSPERVMVKEKGVVVPPFPSFWIPLVATMARDGVPLVVNRMD